MAARSRSASWRRSARQVAGREGGGVGEGAGVGAGGQDRPSRRSFRPGSATARRGASSAGENRPEIELLYDPSHATELAMVRGILTQHVMEAVSAEATSARRRSIDRCAIVQASTGMAGGESKGAARYAAKRPQVESAVADGATPAGGRRFQYAVHRKGRGRDGAQGRAVQRHGALVRRDERPVHPVHGHRRRA